MFKIAFPSADRLPSPSRGSTRAQPHSRMCYIFLGTPTHPHTRTCGPVTPSWSLQVEARDLIDGMTRLTSYNFVALSDKLVPAAEEDKRCVLWDCGRLVRLRPNTWISLDP